MTRAWMAPWLICSVSVLGTLVGCSSDGDKDAGMDVSADRPSDGGVDGAADQAGDGMADGNVPETTTDGNVPETMTDGNVPETMMDGGSSDADSGIVVPATLTATILDRRAVSVRLLWPAPAATGGGPVSGYDIRVALCRVRLVDVLLSNARRRA